MKHAPCKTLNTAELVAYWLGETPAGQAASIEEHLFECPSCTGHLGSIVDIGIATRELIGAGKVAAVLTPAALQKLKTTGLRIREYHLEPNGSVNCTIAPDDDLVVAHLRVPLAGVSRLDLVLEDVDAAQQFRICDIGFDPRNEEIVMLPRAEDLRILDRATQRAHLFAVDADGERLLGNYEFRHSRYRSENEER